ncbi:putative rRNA maturation factor YbeY, putative [Trypanosoma equiperdum]|uniref:rRNA maturation factor n=2 Tax=Trypanozoon TaxID=39700 RepID=Q581T7_TRYB2|nr:hypothetical protein, conserved [Trypanosoma brucei brucei TREU927]AAX79883.1 hypothetical protein, conserved [Trypanosoma brucei]AAZ10735.1 hypothetical protein, conserved [Trypanosoma brucei brucei TREU927]SCU66807.1 probable rRNA maturation factor YbeY, putative [Trypanosoma equiperdum]
MPRSLFRNVRVLGATPRFAAGVQGLTEAVLLAERAPQAVELSIHFVTPGRMHELNLEHRGVDKPTDVLTFPGSGSGTPYAKFLNETVLLARVEGDNACVADPSVLAERRALLQELGDIYFSVEYISMRCSCRPTHCLRFHDYLQAALTHALLHALGYDHATPEQWKRMTKRERFLRHRLSVWRRRWPGCLQELDGVEMLMSPVTR